MTFLSRIGPGAWCFLGLWAGLVVAGRTSLFRDPGTFWHVRVGETILGGTFPDRDTYTFTFAGTPWAPHGWLGEVLMAVVHVVAGFDGLLLASAAVIAATFAPLFVRIHRTGLHWSLAGCVVVLAVSASAGHFHARPHLLTIAFFAELFLRIQDVDSGRVSVRGLWWVVPLFVVWANTHGGVLAGYGTLGLAAAGWVAFRAIGWPSPVRDRRDGLVLAAILGVTALTPLANPYGLGLPRAWLDIMRMSELPRIIKEHAAVDPADPSSWAFFALGAFSAVALAGIREKPRVTWLLPVVWFVLGCERVRHAPLFAVAAAAAFADYFPRTVWAKLLAARPDFYVPRGESEACPRAGWCGSLAVGTALVAGFATVAVGGGWRLVELDREMWPVDLLPALHREAAGRRDVPIFNEYEYGGFLIYFAPEYRPFVDDRCEIFGGPWLAEFVDAGRTDPAPAMAKWAAAYPRFDLALTRDGGGFARYFAARPETWEAVATDGFATLFRRRTPQ